MYNGDAVSIAPGYTAKPFLVLGEPIMGPDFGDPDANTVENFENCTGAQMEQRVGSHHDGMHYFPLPDNPDHHGILCLNHEYIDARKMFPATGRMPTSLSGSVPPTRCARASRPMA